MPPERLVAVSYPVDDGAVCAILGFLHGEDLTGVVRREDYT